MSIPRWAFVIEKICDGQIAQIADGEYPGKPFWLLRKWTHVRSDVTVTSTERSAVSDVLLVRDYRFAPGVAPNEE